MTHPSPTAEDFAAATERAQSFLSDSQFIGADRNIARCFLEQSKRIAALEAELVTQRRVGVHEICSMCGLDLRKATTECPTWHGLDHLGCDYAKKAEAQLATRLPTEAQISYLLEVLAKEGVTNGGGDFMRRKISKAILALLSGAATPAPTAALTEEEIDAVWDALRERVCSSKLEAKRCVMVSRADLTHAMRAKSPPQGAEE